MIVAKSFMAILHLTIAPRSGEGYAMLFGCRQDRRLRSHITAAAVGGAV
jgi:hypothetical protein